MACRFDRSLPEELVLKIFSTKNEDNEYVLDLEDRIRCRALCKAWRSYLDPHRSVLREFELSGAPGIVASFMPVLNGFTNLTYLALGGLDSWEYTLNSKPLSSMPMLQKMMMFECGLVELVGDVSPSLQHLVLDSVEKVVLNGALPRLRTLELTGVRDLRLAGEALDLPALVRIHAVGMAAPIEAEVDMDKLAALNELALRGTAITLLAPALGELAALHHLRLLELECNDPEEQAAAEELLHSTPQSLQRLELKVVSEEEGLPFGQLEPGLAGAIGACTQLTALTLRASGPMGVLLGPPARLQDLHPSSVVRILTGMELAQVAHLRQLRRFVLTASQVQAGKEAVEQGALKVLMEALPEGCLVELE